MATSGGNGLQYETRQFTDLYEPNMNQQRQERMLRNEDIMMQCDSSLTKQIFPKKLSWTTEDKAAIKIQSFYRGRLGRKQYFELLWQQYEELEDVRMKKITEQMEEGEMLIDIQRLELEHEENATVFKNRARLHESRIITLQRAWRKILKQRNLTGRQQNTDNILPNGSPIIAWTMPVSPETDSKPYEHNVYNSGHLDNKPGLSNIDSGNLLDLDYTEMADPMKQHLANMQYLQQSQKKPHVMDDNQLIEVDNETHNILRNADETDDEYSRRIRKTNLLSLAQEFAALKQVQSGSTLYDVVKTSEAQNDYSPMSEVSTESESDEENDDVPTPPIKDSQAGPKKAWANNAAKSAGNSTTESGAAKTPSSERLQDFDVYNIESTMPEVMDWTLLEQQLQKAAEEQQQRQSRRNDREEIRRKLAMGSGADEDYYAGERAFRKPNLQSRLQGGMNLQVCFMNDVPADESGATTEEPTKQPSSQTTAPPATQAAPPAASHSKQTLPHPKTSTPQNPVAPKHEPVPGDEDFFSRQERLQREARMALAQVRPMAHMQLQVEKEQKKKSPISEIIGLPTLGGRKRQTRQALVEMNIAQLQVVVNDMHTQIENLNDELVRMLLRRDELHMEQDSMLVDIEDHTRRAQECAERTGTKVPSLSAKRT